MKPPRDIYADLQDRDPSGLWASISVIVASLISLAVAYGVEVPPDAEAAILRIVAVAGPLLAGLGGSGRLPGQSEGAWAPRSVHDAEHPPEEK